MTSPDALLKELGFKTPIGDIDTGIHDIIFNFLKTERDYRKQYRIKRLLSLSGIKQVKTFNRFDWRFNPKIAKKDTDILFQIISKRSELLPTIVTTNLPPKEWGSIFSGAAASAILDRLSYNGRFITFEGRSYRLLKKHISR